MLKELKDAEIKPNGAGSIVSAYGSLTYSNPCVLSPGLDLAAQSDTCWKPAQGCTWTLKDFTSASKNPASPSRICTSHTRTALVRVSDTLESLFQKQLLHQEPPVCH